LALNSQIADSVCNAQADVLARLLDAGLLRIYSGTQPATADTVLSGNTLLAELVFNATSAPAASGGVLTFNSITADSSANATGTATFFRAVKADGTTVILDGSVGTATSNMIIAAVEITALQTVSCSSFTHDCKNSTSGL
jgi:hypothetical protein